MKMNNKLVVKLVAIALLSGMIVTFTHCVPQTAKEVGNGGGYRNTKSTITTPSAPKDEGQIINEIQVTTGVKNHEQILHTMGAVTGIDPFSVTSIMNAYRQVEASLPTDNNIKVFTSTQQVAITKLAAEFCYQLTETAFANQRASIWPGLDLGRTPDSVFSQDNSVLFINQTIDAFWGGILSQEEHNMAMDEFLVLIDNLLADQNTSGVRGATGRTVRGVCTAALSSAYVTLL